jgi:hypothetical protein
MSYLRSVNELYPIWALPTQDMLWANYDSNSTGLGSGISAMPSLHVALATLNALLLSRLSRTAGILGWLVCGGDPRRVGPSRLALCHRRLCRRSPPSCSSGGRQAGGRPAAANLRPFLSHRLAVPSA